MDWSKAKNILIAALLAADLFLGMQYFELRRSEQTARVQEAACTESYLQSLGVSLQCSLPAEEERLAVVFVRIGPSASSEKTEAPDGRPIAVTGAEGLAASAVSVGDNRGEIISAANAALRLLALPQAEDPSSLTIRSAELVYLVDRSGMEGEIGQDTAVPAWAFETGTGTLYVQAFAD